MIKSQVNTVQNVAISFQLASLGQRAGAWTIDIVIVWMYLVLGFQLLDALNFNTSWNEITIGNVLLIVPALLYHLLMEITLQGQSPGKKIMGIRVMLTNGNQPSIGNYLIRWVFRLIEFTIFFGLAMLAYLYIDKGQRIGDVMAGTFVVKIPKKTHLSDTILGIQNKDYKPVYIQAQQLTGKDMAIIQDIYLPLVKQKKYTLLLALANQISETLQIKHQQTPAAFITTIVNDYNYYATQDQA